MLKIDTYLKTETQHSSFTQIKSKMNFAVWMCTLLETWKYPSTGLCTYIVYVGTHNNVPSLYNVIDIQEIIKIQEIPLTVFEKLQTGLVFAHF